MCSIEGKYVDETHNLHHDIDVTNIYVYLLKERRLNIIICAKAKRYFLIAILCYILLEILKAN